MLPPRRSKHHSLLRALTGSLAVGIAIAATGAPADAQERMGDGFFFGAPRMRLTLTGGLVDARAKSEIYTFTTEQLTLDRKDFRAPSIEMNIGIRTGNRSELELGVGIARSSTRSEFRDWVDQDDLPIEQTTSLTRVPLMASYKLYLMAPGHSVGRLAWVPSSFALYVGGGTGAMWYKFDQKGDWIDYQTLDVFPDEFKTAGWGVVGQVMGGADISLSPRIGATAQIRKHWASGPLNDTFVGFGNQGIDLSGVTTRAGFFIRF